MKTIRLGFILTFICVAAFAQQDSANWQKQAVQRYPALGTPGSPLNAAFVAKVAARKGENPAYFKSTDWPIRLAQECWQELSTKREANLREIVDKMGALKVPGFTIAPSPAGSRFGDNLAITGRLLDKQKGIANEIKAIRDITSARVLGLKIRTAGPGICLQVVGSVPVPRSSIDDLLGPPDKVEQDVKNPNVSLHHYGWCAFSYNSTAEELKEFQICCDLLQK